MKIKADIVVVGSGAGGATVAKELAKAKRNVLVVERGTFVRNVGTQREAFRFYDRCALRTSKEGTIVYRTLMVGGTTVVSCGSGLPVLDKELKAFGIDLHDEFAETERELNIAPLPNKLIGKGSKLIMDVGNKFGLDMKPMPKAMDFKKCVSCGLCVLGCRTGAKWSAVSYIDEMKRHGGQLVTGINVKSIVINKGKAVGLVATRNQRTIRIYANKIILAAGGFGSPVILRRSGVEKAGNKFFADLLNVTYGVSKDKEINLYREPAMAVVSTKFLERKGFIISPFIDVPLILRWTMPKTRHLKGYRHRNLIGIMTKIKDDNKGEVTGQERFFKIPTESDYAKLNEGAGIAKRILLEMGIKGKDIFTTKPRGAHPGGSVAIGDVVDPNLKTDVENLFVCDASVLPVSCGAPPIVTIVSLAKRLSKHLLQHC